jgi:hypothetical protein
MKTILTAFVVLLTVASCNLESKLTTFFKEKCPNSTITKTYDGKYLVSVECANLYETAEVKKLITKGLITYDFANAKLSGVVVSSDSIPNLYAILKGVAKGVNK